MSIINRIFNFNNILRFDLRIIGPIIILCIIGLIALKSASLDTLGQHSVFYNQIQWIIIGLITFLVIQFIRNNLFYEFAYIFYLILLILLFITLFMPKTNGSTRWILIGGIQFQPSEFGKIIFIMAVSRFITDYRDSFTAHQLIITCAILTLIPLAFIVRQPDYGTGIIYLLPILPMLYWANVDSKKIVLYIFPIISMLAQRDLLTFYIWMFLLIIILLFISKKIIQVVFNFILNCSFGISAPYFWEHALRPYHRERILELLYPGSDPLGAGYQILQSKVAIGSGGILGKGLGEGTQSYLRFLPIKDSDFILSVISEEMGFFCIVIITIIFLLFIYFCMDFSQRLFNRFQSLNIIGLCSLLFFHMVINMSMVVGLFPVIGLPFPFISYGGSFMLTCFIIIGIINNIVNNDL